MNWPSIDGVAERGAGGAEIAREELREAHGTARIGGAVRVPRGGARVVEGVVGEARAPVALHAALSNEQGESVFLVCRERREVTGEVSVEGIGPDAERALVGGDRLAGLDEDLRGSVALFLGEGVVLRVAWTATLGPCGHVGERVVREGGGVPFGVGGGDAARDEEARGAELGGRLERAERLRPEGVGAAVPELPPCVGGERDGGSAPIPRTGALATRETVGEVFRRVVARRTGHLARGGEALVEEEALAERRRKGGVSDCVRGVGGRRAGERRLLEEIPLVLVKNGVDERLCGGLRERRRSGRRIACEGGELRQREGELEVEVGAVRVGEEAGDTHRARVDEEEEGEWLVVRREDSPERERRIRADGDRLFRVERLLPKGRVERAGGGVVAIADDEVEAAEGAFCFEGREGREGGVVGSVPVAGAAPEAAAHRDDEEGRLGGGR